VKGFDLQMRILKCPVKSNVKVARDLYEMAFDARDIAAIAQPGQFVNVQCNIGSSYDPLLKRPFSIYSVSRDYGRVSILYNVVGRGTAFLENVKPGMELDVIGPLGKGFNLDSPVEYILVGGGVGAAPMLFAAEYLGQRGVLPVIILGAQNSQLLPSQGRFERVAKQLHVCTDDGSAGTKGMVTDILTRVLSKPQNRIVLACGSKPMLQACLKLCKDFDVRLQVSLEENMACGIGACTGCVVKTRQGYKRVCYDGPVFDAREVIWD
jgi:dihydroorotate dehydrogenase electron transfer subunit